ncbi:MAG: hypothetical protein ABIR04_00265 [Cypionkella sp.]
MALRQPFRAGRRDIDLLMEGALATASVAAALEGAGWLALFLSSGALEARAMGGGPHRAAAALCDAGVAQIVMMTGNAAAGCVRRG